MNLYFRNTGTSWADPNNWSDTDGGGAAGVIPTATDDVFFTANSSDVIQDMVLLQVIKSLTTLGYTGTINLANPAATPYGISVVDSLLLGSQTKIICNHTGVSEYSTFIRVQGVACTITTNGVFIPAIACIAADTVFTLMDTLNVDVLSLRDKNFTWAGSFGWTAKRFNVSDDLGKTLTLQAGIEYKTGEFESIENTDATHGAIVSSIPGTMAKFTVTGEELVAHMNFTDIDASGGRTIYTFKGVVTNCVNINSFIEPVLPLDNTVASSFAI